MPEFLPKVPAGTRIQHVGLELEGFGPMDRILGLPQCRYRCEHGAIECDVGRNQGELITRPHVSLEEACTALRELLKLLDMFRLQPWRPSEIAGHNEWLLTEKPAVAVMYEALQKECAALGLDFARINVMTNAAAAQLNVSGAFKPLGPQGLVVINVMNAIGPFVAARVHNELGCGLGHLAIWREYADSRRFPRWGEWYPRQSAFRSAFEDVRSLMKPRAGGFSCYPDLNQRLRTRTDHGRWWKLFRPKPIGTTGWYLEARILPSMPVDALQYYACLVIEMIETLLEWSDVYNDAKPVMTMADATPAFELLHHHWPDYVPPMVPDQAAWDAAFLE